MVRTMNATASFEELCLIGKMMRFKKGRTVSNGIVAEVPLAGEERRDSKGVASKFLERAWAIF